MAYAIITDTGSSLPEQYIDEYGIDILSLNVYIEGEEFAAYENGHYFDFDYLYDKLAEGSVVKTSQVPMYKMEDTFRKHLDQGEDVLYIGFSSALSGTMDTAWVVLEQMKAEYPDRKIYGVDSLCASGGEGLLVLLTLAEKEKGATIEEAYEFAESTKGKIAHWFMVDDLSCLVRGGRVSKTKAFAAGVLNIKPVLHVNDAGELEQAKTYRGAWKAISGMFEKLQNTGSPDPNTQLIIIEGVKAPEYVAHLKEKIVNAYPDAKIIESRIDPVISAHTGLGCLSYYFLADER